MTQNNTHTENTAENAMIPAAAEHPVPAPVLTAEAVLRTSDATLPVLENAVADIERILADFWNVLDMVTNMTGQQRRQLISARSRNYGFINKAYAIALENPNFRPANFSFEDMTKNLDILHQSRQLSLVLEQLTLINNDLLLISCNVSYRNALRINNNLREQSRAGIAGARPLYDELLQFFTLHRRGRSADTEQTEKELEHDFHSLIHGHSDGEMIIKNESPHQSGGVHEVVDDVHRHERHGEEIKVEE